MTEKKWSDSRQESSLQVLLLGISGMIWEKPKVERKQSVSCTVMRAHGTKEQQRTRISFYFIFLRFLFLLSFKNFIFPRIIHLNFQCIGVKSVSILFVWRFNLYCIVIHVPLFLSNHAYSMLSFFFSLVSLSRSSSILNIFRDSNNTDIFIVIISGRFLLSLFSKNF